MAEDDTEKSLDPSQKRLQEAHDRGDVVKSQEVSTWFVMAGGTLIVMAFSGAASSGIMTTMRGLIANSYNIRVEGRGFIGVVARLGSEVIASTALPLSLLMLAALAGNLIQHRLVWSGEALKPKFSKVSPGASCEPCSPRSRSSSASQWCRAPTSSPTRSRRASTRSAGGCRSGGSAFLQRFTNR